MSQSKVFETRPSEPVEIWWGKTNTSTIIAHEQEAVREANQIIDSLT